MRIRTGIRALWLASFRVDGDQPYLFSHVLLEGSSTAFARGVDGVFTSPDAPSPPLDWTLVGPR